MVCPPTSRIVCVAGNSIVVPRAAAVMSVTLTSAMVTWCRPNPVATTYETSSDARSASATAASWARSAISDSLNPVGSMARPTIS